MKAVIAGLVACVVAGAIAYAETIDDGFVAYEENSNEGTTWIEPGALVFQGASGGFVELCHYPDEFLMSTGGFLAQSGERGFRVMGSDGQTHGIFGTDDTYGTYVSALPDFNNVPTDLLLYTGGDFHLTMPAAESNGQLRVILNGRPVLISFTEE